MVSAKRTVTICSRGRATSRLTQAPHSRAQTVSRTPPSRSASGRLKDCNWRTSAIDSLLGCGRSEEHTSELQSLMRSSYAVFCLKKKTQYTTIQLKYTNKHMYTRIP